MKYIIITLFDLEKKQCVLVSSCCEIIKNGKIANNGMFVDDDGRAKLNPWNIDLRRRNICVFMNGCFVK